MSTDYIVVFSNTLSLMYKITETSKTYGMDININKTMLIIQENRYRTSVWCSIMDSESRYNSKTLVFQKDPGDTLNGQGHQ